MKLNSSRLISRTRRIFKPIVEVDFFNFINQITTWWLVTENIVELREKLKWDGSFRWSSSLYCLVRNSEQMTIRKTHPMLTGSSLKLKSSMMELPSRDHESVTFEGWSVMFVSMVGSLILLFLELKFLVVVWQSKMKSRNEKDRNHMPDSKGKIHELKTVTLWRCRAKR